jgi:hypothetical protein
MFHTPENDDVRREPLDVKYLAPPDDLVLIGDLKFTGDFFRFFDAKNSDGIFRLVGVADGTITIETLLHSATHDFVEALDGPKPDRVEREGHEPIVAVLQETERQMALMAFAQLALSLPGFDLALGELADKLQGHRMFTAFKRFRRSAIEAAKKGAA